MGFGPAWFREANRLTRAVWLAYCVTLLWFVFPLIASWSLTRARAYALTVNSASGEKLKGKKREDDGVATDEDLAAPLSLWKLFCDHGKACTWIALRGATEMLILHIMPSFAFVLAVANRPDGTFFGLRATDSLWLCICTNFPFMFGAYREFGQVASPALHQHQQ